MTTPSFQPDPCVNCGSGGGGAAGFDAEGAVLCDFDAQGNQVGTALVEATYDQTTGIRTGTRVVDPVTGDPYVPQGTLRPCDTGDCGGPQQFCFTTTSTGPVNHPGRQYDLTLPINPGFAVDSMVVDDTTHSAGITWTVFDRDGENFRQQLTTFMEGRLPADAVVTITNPNAGNIVCGTAVPMTIHIECLRLDQNPPDLVELVYNGGQDLVVNPGYLTTPPTDLSTVQFAYLRRQDAGGTINCTNIANRGWETNDLGDGNRDFELWGTGPGGLQQQEGATPTPRGTPIQEVTADINDTGAGPTIWQTFQVNTPGNFRVQMVHGARDQGEQHTIRLSTGDTNDTGPGDIINDVTTPAQVTNVGGNGPNPWTVLDQTVPLNAGLYTFSMTTTNPVGPNRGGLFTDMRVYQDVPNQRATATVDDDTCAVTVDETTTVTDCQWWDPQCDSTGIVAWRNVETGALLTNVQFWAQVPAPSCCMPAAGGSSSGSVAANLVHSYPVCAVIGGIATTLQRVVITDASGGALLEQFIGPDGAPVAAPTDYTIGTCADTAFVNDEILCDDNGPFLRKYVQSVVGGQGRIDSHRNFTLAGAAYTPVGVVRVCSAGQTLGPVCWVDPDVPELQRQGFMTLGPDGDPVLYDLSGDVVTDYVVVICPEITQQSHVLCDAGNANHQFLRWYVDGPVVGQSDTQWDFELDGSTPYAVVGPVVLCGDTSVGDTRDPEIQILCDATPTRFLRHYIYDGETGAVASVVNTTLDGVTPFVPVGAVGICTTPTATDFDFAIEQLCDNNGAFLRRFTFNSATGAVTTITNTNLAGAAYVPVGTVGSCETCCPQVIGEGCTNVGSGRYTAIRNVNGTVSLIDSVSGAAVVAGNIIACVNDDAVVTQTSEAVLLAAGQSWTPGGNLVGTLTGLTFQVLTGTATLVDTSGTNVAGIPAGTSVSWNAEDNNTLTGPQSITADAASTVLVSWTRR